DLQPTICIEPCADPFARLWRPLDDDIVADPGDDAIGDAPIGPGMDPRLTDREPLRRRDHADAPFELGAHGDEKPFARVGVDSDQATGRELDGYVVAYSIEGARSRRISDTALLAPHPRQHARTGVAERIGEPAEIGERRGCGMIIQLDRLATERPEADQRA